jgi:hypothetical protein
MVTTQQVGEKMTWGLFNKEGLTRFDLQKVVVIIHAKSLYDSF